MIEKIWKENHNKQLSKKDFQAWNQARMARQTIVAMDCAKGDVSGSGGWCLAVDTTAPELAPGRPMAQHHVVGDSGLALAFSELLEGHSLLDLGAGIGQYGVWFDSHSTNLTWYLAFDGASNVETFTKGAVNFFDLTVENTLNGLQAEWVMSLEVGEHVDAVYEDIYLANVHNANTKGLILSWAIPGQGGHSHINERSREYIIEKVTKLGYSYDKEMSEKVLL